MLGQPHQLRFAKGLLETCWWRWKAEDRTQGLRTTSVLGVSGGIFFKKAAIFDWRKNLFHWWLVESTENLCDSFGLFGTYPPGLFTEIWTYHFPWQSSHVCQFKGTILLKSLLLVLPCHKEPIRRCHHVNSHRRCSSCLEGSEQKVAGSPWEDDAWKRKGCGGISCISGTNGGSQNVELMMFDWISCLCLNELNESVFLL